MKRRTQRRSLQFDSLEAKTLLSGGTLGASAGPQTGAAPNVRVEARIQQTHHPRNNLHNHSNLGLGRHSRTLTLAEARRLHALQAGAGTTSTGTGTGTTTSTPFNGTPVNGDIAGLQRVAQYGLLDQLLAQVGALAGTSANVKALSNQLIQDDDITNARIGVVAQTASIPLPTDISAGDQTLAKQVLTALNTSTFDSTFATTLVQLDQAELAQAQQLASTATDASIKALAQSLVTIDQMHLTSAQQLAAGTGTFTGTAIVTATPGTPVPVGLATPLTSAEVTALGRIKSSATLQWMISEIAQIEDSTNSSVVMYAQKAVDDYITLNNQLNLITGTGLAPLLINGTAGGSTGTGTGATATSTVLGGTVIPAGIQTADQTTATNVLKAVNTATFESTYLTTMTTVNQQALSQDQALVTSATNPDVRIVAQNAAADDFAHLLGAQALQAVGGGNPVNNPNITNVQQSFSHPGNGTLVYNLTFDSGGFRFINHYTMTIQSLGGTPGSGVGISGQQAALVFVQGLLFNINQQSGSNLTLGGTGSGTGTTGTGTGTTGTGM